MVAKTVSLRPIILSLLILATVMFGTQQLAIEVQAAGECCDSQSVELFLVATDDLSPFESDRGDLQSKPISSSIPSEESIGKWSFQPDYHGDYQATTWEFSIHYEIENAAGVQLNGTVQIDIGPNSFTGQTPAGEMYIPNGAGTLDVEIEVDAGSLVSSDTVSIELILSTMVFVVPSGGASIEFQWGDEDHDSSLIGDLPLLDIDLQTPLVDGRTLHLPAIMRSGFGQKLIENGDISCSVDGVAISEQPVKTPSGQDVKATWSWSAPDGYQEGTITVLVEYSLQSGSESWKAIAEFDITLGDGDGSTTFYSEDEPLRPAHGSKLNVRIDADIQKDAEDLVITRNTVLTIQDDMAYWMRWGITNQGAEGLESDSIWALFDGVFSEDQYSDKVIDNAELEKMATTLQSGALMNWFLEGGLQLEPEELLGGFNEFHTFRVQIELNDDYSVSRQPVKLKVSTTQSINDGEYFEFLEQFISPQIDVFWKSVSLQVDLQTDSQSSLIGISEDSTEDLQISHERHFTKEVLTLSSKDILDWNRMDIRIKPSTNPLHAPLPLFMICMGLIVVMFGTCFLLSKGKTRKPLYLESLLIPLVALAYWFAYPIENLGALMGLVGGMWMVTTLITPRRIGEDDMPDTSDMPEVPTIACPKCTTVNPVVSEVRPLRLPCGGCGRVLKIVG